MPGIPLDPRLQIGISKANHPPDPDERNLSALHPLVERLASHTELFSGFGDIE